MLVGGLEPCCRCEILRYYSMRFASMFISLPVLMVCCWMQAVAAELLNNFRCSVVFLGEQLKQKFYRGEMARF